VAIRTAVGLIAGAILIAVFLRLVNVGAVSRRLAHLEVGFALLSGVAFLGAYVVRSLRWRRLLRPYEVTRRRAASIYLVATFLNWLLPVRGGELAKSLLLRQTDGIPVSPSLATVSMDKVLDLLPAVALLVVLPFVHLRLSRALLLLLLSALVVVGFAAFVLALAAWRRERAQALLTRLLRMLLPRRARERIEPFILLFIDTLLALIRQPRLLLTAAGFTAVAVSFDALFCLFAFRAVGAHVSVPVVLYGYTFFNLAFILPTPPGQVGSNEIIGLLIFSGSLGVNRSAVGAMFLFSHPWNAILLSASGLLCLSFMGLTLRRTLSLAPSEEGVRPAPEREEGVRLAPKREEGVRLAPEQEEGVRLAPEKETWGAEAAAAAMATTSSLGPRLPEL
jgi:uncharacterized protein (TIRG00374 family)